MQQTKGARGGAKDEGGQEAPGRLIRVNADLPETLHTQFKIACAREGTQMAAVLRQLIEDWTRNRG